SFLVMPALAKPIAGGIGRVIGAPFGAVGRLAATNAGRNTRRTAATAFALTLGLTLVAAFGTLGATTKASIDGIIDDGLDADVVVHGVPTGGEMPIPRPRGHPDPISGGRRGGGGRPDRRGDADAAVGRAPGPDRRGRRGRRRGLVQLRLRHARRRVPAGRGGTRPGRGAGQRDRDRRVDPAGTRLADRLLR